MKIANIDDLHADAGWRNVSFVKITTEDGLTGWSEYRADAGNAGVTGVIRALAELLIGKDPRRVESMVALLRARTLQACGGINQHAIAALVNALLDIKAKALGISVSSLFGGPVRSRIPLYWSHCGSYRLRHADLLGSPPVRNFEDIAGLGREVRDRGFKALKASVLGFDGQKLISFGPGFGWSPGFPELNLDRQLLLSIERMLASFREGAGDEVGLLLDLNCHFRTEGFIQIARTVEKFGLVWLEVDSLDPRTLSLVRKSSRCPIASYEIVYGRHALRPFLDAQAADVAIIDVNWNGFLEATKMASLAETYDLNVATHNYGGVLGEYISAQFAAAIPNLRLMEFDVDDVPWANDFVTHSPVIEDGEWIVSDRPGWGTEVNEAALRARPPKTRA